MPPKPYLHCESNPRCESCPPDERRETRDKTKQRICKKNPNAGKCELRYYCCSGSFRTCYAAQNYMHQHHRQQLNMYIICTKTIIDEQHASSKFPAGPAARCPPRVAMPLDELLEVQGEQLASDRHLQLVKRILYSSVAASNARAHAQTDKRAQHTRAVGWPKQQ